MIGMAKKSRRFELESGIKIDIIQGDITTQKVDAIVSPSDQLLGIGGPNTASGAIATTAGKAYFEELVLLRGKGVRVNSWSPVVTGAGKLHTRYVIHVAGPIWQQGDEGERLIQAINGAMDIATQYNIQTIAFPAISAGTFSTPPDLVAVLFCTAIINYRYGGSSLREIHIVLKDPTLYALFLETFEDVLTRHGH
jgi:O-acetyl-ADP-ribose deacetylase (regulator of RNase III)